MAHQEDSSSGLSHTARRRSGIPRGFDNLLHPTGQTVHSAGRTSATTSPTASRQPSSRLRLHIRQQPVATRACSAGEKDRRTIDPPPILQLLLADFNPGSEADLAILQNSRFTVGCLLYLVKKSSSGGEDELIHHSRIPESPTGHRRDERSKARSTYQFDSRTTTTRSHVNEKSNPSDERYVQILSGKTYVSPFHVPYDPDPETAPNHPSSHSHQAQTYHHHHRRHNVIESPNPPATFFVFADLSIRTSGTYRLKFRLMDWGLAAETGVPQPILAECLSDAFEVFSSKEFPGLMASSALTWNLRKMGMMELKPRDGKGKGVAKKGKRRVDGGDQ
ncbi:conserved hypothetical protein [Talaromyces stipitatus ATCC 10500]|uniref:Velvet domain-containing protein n=1 Tax=Talaromyces stipitatus (strain ATCC 10500 / CBS 375.48 / QM 6759 / NRRL 1006) TaxID=441959 RepID=B8MLA5_TALSN|nr:uncharacterized protein TSTA_044840 [Talaromyces stipitatus ATCC 10500]EED15020.1 conserved hypothetical protein [Talaromyces stipitatus ATCC 10500]